LRYVFPEVGDHTIEWIGKRYMLIKTDGVYKIEFYQAAGEFIDNNAVDYILLDGDECMPFAVLNNENQGKVRGKLLATNITISYLSLDDARRGLVKEWGHLRRRAAAD